MDNEKVKVLFLGMGYIGLPTAAFAASRKIKVTGFDINPHVVETVNRGEIHIVEPELDSMVRQAVNSGYLLATGQPVEADVYVVVVPTPFKQDRLPDISHVEAATRSVIPLLKPGDLFIIESTSPVMTTEKMADMIFGERPELKDRIYVAYCPERVLPGNVIYELEHNDRVIGGINSESTAMACEFYSMFVKGKLHETNARTAEMCKLVENSSRDVQIAFANELSLMCDRAEIDVWELIRLANRHPRVNILQPGCGVGGHCIAVDPWFIVAEYPEHAKVIRQAREVNDRKAEWCVSKILDACAGFETVNHTRPVVACMGLAFKADIDDMRESPARYISLRIMSEFKGEALLVEPNIAGDETLTPYDEAYRRADIVVWLVKHREFLLLEQDNGKIEMDFCGLRKMPV
ncbi:MAG: UDP-N-acetyl-D-mannosamine dehydrogenase [Prevotellaceae bacterium]|jgi:UDP-N-acetyl-D-mannosaminuronic acid dehydrogenase|nr:UDP-N-acetyl-D-mannosamine dehydrogenase [Prevotellaceae bacterium]